jgi:hypothetical protein
MANKLERTPLVTEMAELQNKQYESLATAIYQGWTAEALAAWDKRDARITYLAFRLAEIDAASLARAS